MRGVAAIVYAPDPLRRLCDILVVLATLIVGVGGMAAPASAIANGEVVPDGRYPFAVKITTLDIPTADGGTRDSSCSGGLVSPHWVITAASGTSTATGCRARSPPATSSPSGAPT
jgi:secreted trypsin-like serine protease